CAELLGCASGAPSHPARALHADHGRASHDASSSVGTEVATNSRRARHGGSRREAASRGASCDGLFEEAGPGSGFVDDGRHGAALPDVTGTTIDSIQFDAG